MNNTKKNKLKAFTAIGIVISIIIASLIIAVLIFMQDLNKSAGTKSLIAQIASYDSAVKQFYLKYNSLPGDSKSTVAFGLSKTNSDGNDDGLIKDAKGGTNEFSGEIANFWMHLGNSRFVRQNFDGNQNENAKINQSFPSSKIGDNIGITVFGYNGKNYYQIGVSGADKNHIIMTDKSLKPTEAFSFDVMVDDGNPTTGRVVAVTGSKVNGLTDKDKKCFADKEYKTNDNNPTCQIRIEFGSTINLTE